MGAPADMLPDPTESMARQPQPSIQSRVHEQAARTPESVAVYDLDGHDVTYRDLSAGARRLARHLVSLGVRRGDVVCVLAQRSVALPWALLGVLDAGAAFAILDPEYPDARLAAAIAVARPRAWIVLNQERSRSPELQRALEESGCSVTVNLPLLPGDFDWPEDTVRDALPSLGVTDGDVAYVAFTSGTTGAPKGVVGTHAPVSHFIEWHLRRFALSASDRFVMLAGLAHDPLLRDVFVHLSCGATLVVPPRAALRDPSALRAVLAEERVTTLHLTPSLAHLLALGRERDVAYRQLPALRWAFFGGESLKRASVSDFVSLAPHARCVNFYGATETPQAMGYHVLEPADLESGSDSIVPVGRGIADVQLLIVNSEGGRAAVGEPGEVHVRTPYLARGYLGDESLTASRFVKNPFRDDAHDRLYKTGDLGRYSTTGVVEVLGRADRQVKVRGFRVELDDVEATLQSHPEVSQAAVSVAQDGVEARIAAYVVATPTVTAQTLRAFAADRLPEYMLPASIAVLERLPLTANGKVDRASLPGVGASEARALGASEGAPSPRNDIERRLANVWRDVLRVGSVGRDESFFDLGGESLKGLELLLRVEEVFHRRLPVNSLLLASSVAKMAALLVDSQSPRTSRLVPIRDQGARPPVYWLPGGGGLSVMAFRAISHRLGPEQPVYGLEADLDLATAPSTLAEMARNYVSEIRAHQAHGPYYLIGFSLGSFVAYEMAVQLRAAGEPIGQLVVVDTAVPSAVRRRDALKITAGRTRYRIEAMLGAEEGWRTAAAAWLRQQARIVRERSRALARPHDEPTQFDAIIARNLAAVHDYAKRPLPRYDGTVCCVLADSTSMHGVDAELDPRLGWRKYADGGVEVHHVTGNHLSMLEAPHVDVLAATLRASLRAAQARAR